MPKNGMSIHETKTWPDLALGLYERLTGRRSQISYEFHNLKVNVPSKTGPDAEHALWTLNGTLKIHTSDQPETN